MKGIGVGIALLCAIIVILSCVSSVIAGATSQDFEIVITNGRIIDGTGSPGTRETLEFETEKLKPSAI
jgi:hypothetical protein